MWEIINDANWCALAARLNFKLHTTLGTVPFRTARLQNFVYYTKQMRENHNL